MEPMAIDKWQFSKCFLKTGKTCYFNVFSTYFLHFYENAFKIFKIA